MASTALTHRERAEKYAAELTKARGDLQKANECINALEGTIADCKDVFRRGNSAAVDDHVLGIEYEARMSRGSHSFGSPLTDNADTDEDEDGSNEGRKEKTLRVMLDQRESYISASRKQKATLDGRVSELVDERDALKKSLEEFKDKFSDSARKIAFLEGEGESHLGDLKKRYELAKGMLRLRDETIAKLKAEPGQLKKMLSVKAQDELLAADKRPDSVAELQETLGYEKKRR